jgi:hypothetical protein
VIVFEADEVAPVSRLERQCAVWRGRPRVELPRLDDRTARELGAGDARREPEIVLDPARGTRLPAERRALDDERLQPLGRGVDGGAQAGGPAADHDHVDLFRGCELAADPERA